jgi:hypothetical protein
VLKDTLVYTANNGEYWVGEKAVDEVEDAEKQEIEKNFEGQPVLGLCDHGSGVDLGYLIRSRSRGIDG